MSKPMQLPKGHVSILSPQFKYVPAAATDLAATFARIRRDALQPRTAAGASAPQRGRTDETAELGIEVLEAAWP